MPIHTLADYRNSNTSNNTSAGRYPAPPAGSSSRFGTISQFRDPFSASSSQQRLSSYEPDKLGLSFARPIENDDGSPPNMAHRCCPRMKLLTFTSIISIIDIIVFIAELIVGSTRDGAFVSSNELGGPSACTLYFMGAKWEPAIHEGRIYRLLIPIFLHAGVLHILFNLFFQLRLGYIEEARWGWRRLMFLYFLTGIIASMWSSVIDRYTISVGASGAIFGMIGADVTYLMYNYYEIPDNRTEAIFLAVALLINLIIGIAGSGIDNWAHLGGFCSGIFLGIALPPHLTKRNNEKLYRILAAVGLLVEVAILSGVLWGRSEPALGSPC